MVEVEVVGLVVLGGLGWLRLVSREVLMTSGLFNASTGSGKTEALKLPLDLRDNHLIFVSLFFQILDLHF